MAKQRVVLKYKPHLPVAGMLVGDVGPVLLDPPGVGPFETSDDAQQRCLARSGRTKQRQQSAVRYFQRHIVERLKRPEFLGDAADMDAHGMPAYE